MLRTISPAQSVLLSVGLASVIFALDLLTPLGIANGMLYVTVILASLWVPSRKAPIVAAVATSGLVFLGLMLSPSGHTVHAVVNRSMSIVLLVATAVLVKRREIVLLEAEERYQQLVGSAHAIVWRGNTTTLRFTYVSRQAECILGYPTHFWTDQATFWEDHIVPEDRDRVLAACAEATVKGTRHQFDYRMIAADGRIVWLRDYVHVIMQDGRPKESIGVMVDITDQKHAEQALRQSEERYRALVEVSPNAIFINRQDRIVFMNERGLRLFRATSPDQVIGQYPLDYFHPAFHPVIRQRIKHVMTTGTPAGLMEQQIVCLDGTVIDVEVDAIRIMDGGIPAIQVVLRDITERREAEREREVLIQQLNARVGKLTLLQNITRLFQGSTEPLESILSRIASLIPSGWQDSRVCGARVIVDDITYTSDSFEESPWSLREDISVGGRNYGHVEIVYRDGALTAVEDPLHDADREFIKLLAKHCALCLQNREVQAALQQSEARFREAAERTRLMMDALPVCVAYVDREHCYQQNNEGYRRWFGDDPAMLKGRHLRDVLGAVAYEAIRPKVETALQGHSVEFETEVPYAKGGPRRVQVAYIPHRDPGGEVLGFYGLVQDVSARHRSEEALRQSEERLRKVFSVLTEGVLVQDADGAIIACNASGEKILGVPAEHLIGRTLLDRRWGAIREDGAPFPAEQHPITRTLTTGESSTDIVIGINRPDGTFVWISINTKPLVRPGDARPYGAVSSFQDVTKRRETEAALKSLLDQLESHVAERTRELQKANAAMIEEVAQRRETEAALRRSEAGLAEAQRIAHIGSWELDVASGVLTWSDEIYRIFEIDRREFKASYEAFLAAVHPEDRASVDQVYRESVRERRPYEMVHRLLMHDGREKFVQERGETVYDPAGTPLITIGTIQDVTERKKAEEMLRQLHADLEERVKRRTLELVETNRRLEAEVQEHTRAKEGLQRRDAILQAVSFSAKQFLVAPSWADRLPDVLRWLGEAAAADYVGVYRNTHAEQPASRLSLEAAWHSPGASFNLDHARTPGMLYCGNRHESWLDQLARGVPVVAPPGILSEPQGSLPEDQEKQRVALIPIRVGEELWGVMLFVLLQKDRSWQSTDIDALQIAARTFGAAIQRQSMEAQIRLQTEELEKLVTQRTKRIHELETQRAQAEKLAGLGQLAAGVAHEINNPVAGIKNAFLVLKEAIPTTHPHYSFVGMIEREIERITTIVRRMYDLYRHESQQEQALSLDLLLDDVAYLLKPKLTERRVHLRRHIASEIPTVRMVQRDLLQVVLNLAQNAVEASSQEAVVDIAVTHDREHIRIRVSDTGSGIDPEELPHIFEPFFSGQRKRAQGGGMGLGLSVSYSLVQAMGGRIDVLSRPDAGATFTVILPFTRPPHLTTQLKGDPR